MSNGTVDNIITCQKIYVTSNGKSRQLQLKMTEADFRKICVYLRENDKLWNSFARTIQSFREIDRLGIADTASGAPLTTEEINEILEILEKRIKYGKALLSTFMDHAKQVGVDTMESYND